MATNNHEPEELLDLTALSKEQIVEYLPGRYFMYLRKKYECASCRLLPDNKKFSITTYTNPVVIAYEDIGELTMVHGVILPPRPPKRKTTKERKERISIEYTYTLLVKMVNKPSNMSWLEFAENNGRPDQSAAFYQKYNAIIASAKDHGITPNQYVDTLKDNPMGRLNTARQLKIIASIKKPISNEISQSAKTSNTEKQSERNGTNISEQCDKTSIHSSESFEEKFRKYYPNSDGKETSTNQNESSGETEQNRNSEQHSNEKQSTENGNQNTSKSQSKPKETLGINGDKPADMSEILKMSGKDMLYAAISIFEAKGVTWNKRRYYLQQMFPDFHQFRNSNFIESFNKPDLGYVTTQEKLFHEFLLDETKSKTEDTFVDNKTTIKENSPLKNSPAIKDLKVFQPNGNNFLETLKQKRAELQSQLDYHDYLIGLYEKTH